MFGRPTKEINAEYPAEEKYLDSVQRVVRQACVSAGMQRKDVSAIQLAVEEAATNIIRHAYLYEKGMLRIRIVIHKKQITFSLIDSGRSFRPKGSGRLDLQRLVDSGRRGGLGFYMIQKIMDTVDYVSTGSMNELRMTKRLDLRADKGTTPLLRRMFSLRFKFSFWTAVIVFIIIASSFYYVNDRTTREIYRQLDGTVAALGSTISEQAGLYMINTRSDVEFDELVVSYCNSNPILERVVLTDTSGLVVAHSDDNRYIRKIYEYPSFADSAILNSPQHASRGAAQSNYLILQIRTGQRVLGLVHVTYSSEAIMSQLAEAREVTLLLTGAMILIGVLGIYFLSNRFVRPIVNITRRVRRFSSGDLETELPVEGADEFFEISTALNEMMTRLRRDRGAAIEREKMAKEIEVASEIQKTLLPRQLPKMKGLNIDAFYKAASMIGGDLYDVFMIGEDKCCLVVADVSGKGVPASLVMSMLRTVIKIYSEGSDSARNTLILVNDYLSGNMPRGMFITVLMAIYDANKRALNFVSAGHNPMLLFKGSTRSVVKLNPSGMPLGVPVTLDGSFSDSLEEIHLQLENGDLFLLYTDGITEEVNRDGKQFGIQRLADFMQEKLKDGHLANIREFSDAIINEVNDFSGLSSQKDDITFVVGQLIPTDVSPPIDESVGAETVDSTTIVELPRDLQD
ncbi:MAG: hypothetical protein DRP45_00685 [Candidatus Zixiibacteriota bacterium]|nr:MAG: hypothetical protein DRP45_00685 [candidate division Zixibacteria bacterium]